MSGDVCVLGDLARRYAAICKGLHIDITLKDVHTIEGDADRLRH